MYPHWDPGDKEKEDSWKAIFFSPVSPSHILSISLQPQG